MQDKNYTSCYFQCPYFLHVAKFNNLQCVSSQETFCQINLWEEKCLNVKHMQQISFLFDVFYLTICYSRWSNVLYLWLNALISFHPLLSDIISTFSPISNSGSSVPFLPEAVWNITLWYSPVTLGNKKHSVLNITNGTVPSVELLNAKLCSHQIICERFKTW